MKYALANSLSTAVSGLDPDAKAYIDAVVAAGATVTSTQKNAINVFVKDGKSDGWYSSLRRFYLPIWAAASPNAIDMIDLGSGTFNGTVTHASGYVQGNGTTGYFNSNTTSTTGFGWTAGSAFLGFLCNQADSRNDSRHFCGYTTGGAERTCINQNTSDINGSHPTISNTFGASGATIEQGIICLNSNSTSFRELRRRTSSSASQIASSAATYTTAPLSNNIFFLARNAGGIPFSYTDARLGALFGGAGMTSANCDLFSASLKSLWETCTGLTLP